jgi:hypothetical protein
MKTVHSKHGEIKVFPVGGTRYRDRWRLVVGFDFPRGLSVEQLAEAIGERAPFGGNVSDPETREAEPVRAIDLDLYTD